MNRESHNLCRRAYSLSITRNCRSRWPDPAPQTALRLHALGLASAVLCATGLSCRRCTGDFRMLGFRGVSKVEGPRRSARAERQMKMMKLQVIWLPHYAHHAEEATVAPSTSLHSSSAVLGDTDLLRWSHRAGRPAVILRGSWHSRCPTHGGTVTTCQYLWVSLRTGPQPLSGFVSQNS